MHNDPVRLEEMTVLDSVSPTTPMVRHAPGSRRGAAEPAATTIPMAPSNIPVGGTTIGHYELIRELGHGGMGTVFLARDTKLGRRVAIKFLQSQRRDQTERFLIEARATARCSHDNIVVIHDVGEHQDSPFMVLEYLQGKPLGKLIEQGKMPPSRAIELIVPVVRALVCAHELNIVHRDLKPDNIFLTSAGTIKVLDFGIAKIMGKAADASHLMGLQRSISDVTRLSPGELTRLGALVGTLPYMSPEQWGADEIDHRTDLWAVGIILYKMVTGKHPLEPLRGEQLAITGILDQPMPSVRQAGVPMPEELADIIDSCLRKHKVERIGSAKKLLEALEPLMPSRSGRELDSDESPYTGLTAFQEADANRFFGRTNEISRFLAQLHDVPLMGVVGPSGVGKSSFVRAGIIPALKFSGDAWESMVIRPGRHPLAALASILAPVSSTASGSLSDQVAQHQDMLRRLYDEPGYLGNSLRRRARAYNRKILLFIDQFEELYTLIPDYHERVAFTRCLVGMADDALSPLRVILSIRSDFLDRVSEDRQFMAELSQGLYFLPPPDRDGLRDALVRPAEMARYRFETPAMVESMLDSLQSTPGSLPLLQFAASKLWELRDRRRRLLTEASYRAIGGIDGALASHADKVLNALQGQAQHLVRMIFLQLVTAERTRAIVSVNELCDILGHTEHVQWLVGELVNARLLVVQRGDTSSGSTVEIVHESLIRSWPTLARWLDEHQEDAAYVEQLRQAAKQWEAKGRPSGLLWRGEAMEEAQRFARRYRGPLAPLQREYLQAVIAYAARMARIRRISVIGTIAVLSLLVVAAAVALVVIREAQTEADRQAVLAAEQAQRAEEQALVAEAQAERAEAKEREARDAKVEVQKKYDELQAATRARDIAKTELVKTLDELRRNQEELKRANGDLVRALAEARQAKNKVDMLLDAKELEIKKLKEKIPMSDRTLIKKPQKNR